MMTIVDILICIGCTCRLVKSEAGKINQDYG